MKKSRTKEGIGTTSNKRPLCLTCSLISVELLRSMFGMWTPSAVVFVLTGVGDTLCNRSELEDRARAAKVSPLIV